MPLLERVTTLIRANINDLIERAEDPEKVSRQVILDMRNQLLQVKTQVAIAIADEHLLRKKKKEHEDLSAEWMAKAEFALAKEQEDLARMCLDKSLSSKSMAASFEPQIADQSGQVENLKSALLRLQAKLAETEAAMELLVARHRRSRMMQRAGEARSRAAETGAATDRVEDKVMMQEALGLASEDMAQPDAGERVARMEREAEVARMLAELKAKRG